MTETTKNGPKDTEAGSGVGAQSVLENNIQSHAQIETAENKKPTESISDWAVKLAIREMHVSFPIGDGVRRSKLSEAWVKSLLKNAVMERVLSYIEEEATKAATNVSIDAIKSVAEKAAKDTLLDLTTLKELRRPI